MIRNLRWYIAGMLMLATTVNYLDRQSLAIALPALRTNMGLTSEQYSHIVSTFMIAYGIMLPISGRILDAIGVRWGFLLCILWWSAANCAHTFARTAGQLAGFRFLLGMGEAGNFPASIKAVSEWFPPRERAMATGIFNLGAGTGAVLAPPIVGYLVLRFGWQVAFIVTGSIGFAWAVAWLLLYRCPEEHARLSPEELAHIQGGEESPDQCSSAAPSVCDRHPGGYDDRLEASLPRPGGPEEERPAGSRSHTSPPRLRGPWAQAVASPDIWPLIAARILSDPVWLFYLMWLPDYLNRVRGFDLKQIALFGWIPYLAADLGSLVGGGISLWFVKLGMPTLKARKLAMGLCASLMPAAIPAVLARSPITAMVFISIATFGHQSWSASFITLPADLFPKRIVASVFGLTAMCGFFAGAGFTVYVGRVVDTLGYVPVFTMVGFMHLLATAILALSIKPRPQVAVNVTLA